MHNNNMQKGMENIKGGSDNKNNNDSNINNTHNRLLNLVLFVYWPLIKNKKSKLWPKWLKSVVYL